MNKSLMNSLLGEITVEDPGVISIILKVLSHGSAGVGSQELEGADSEAVASSMM